MGPQHYPGLMEAAVKKVRGGKGTYLDAELINSDAFRDLTQTAILVYLDFRLRMKIFKKTRNSPPEITNNGELVYTYIEAEKAGISRPSFQRAIDQLIEYGFIYIAESGAGLFRSATLYGMSGQWKKWGTPSFTIIPRPRRNGLFPNVGFKKGHPYYPPTKERANAGGHGEL
jgi:hypothetical protein